MSSNGLQRQKKMDISRFEIGDKAIIKAYYKRRTYECMSHRVVDYERIDIADPKKVTVTGVLVRYKGKIYYEGYEEGYSFTPTKRVTFWGVRIGKARKELLVADEDIIPIPPDEEEMEIIKKCKSCGRTLDDFLGLCKGCFLKKYNNPFFYAVLDLMKKQVEESEHAEMR